MATSDDKVKTLCIDSFPSYAGVEMEYGGYQGYIEPYGLKERQVGELPAPSRAGIRALGFSGTCALTLEPLLEVVGGG